MESACRRLRDSGSWMWIGPLTSADDLSAGLSVVVLETKPPSWAPSFVGVGEVAVWGMHANGEGLRVTHHTWRRLVAAALIIPFPLGTLIQLGAPRRCGTDGGTSTTLACFGLSMTPSSSTTTSSPGISLPPQRAKTEHPILTQHSVRECDGRRSENDWTALTPSFRDLGA